MTVKYSIVIPARNAEATIERAVTSCLAQSHGFFEVLVVVNDSSDRTQALVEGFQDPRVRVLSLSEAGRSRARNRALDMATGDYVVFLDADDELRPDKLTNVTRALEAHADGVDAVQGATHYRDDQGREVVTPAYTGGAPFERLLVGNMLPINSVVISRRLCARFPESMEHCEDWLFWLESLKGARFACYSDPDAIVHRHGANTSANIVAMQAFELVPRLRYWKHPSRTALDRIKRGVLLMQAMLAYAEVPPNPTLERLLTRHRVAEKTVATLRRHSRVRDATRSALGVVLRQEAT